MQELATSLNISTFEALKVLRNSYGNFYTNVDIQKETCTKM